MAVEDDPLYQPFDNALENLRAAHDRYRESSGRGRVAAWADVERALSAYQEIADRIGETN